jgi:hypothetical protein
LVSICTDTSAAADCNVNSVGEENVVGCQTEDKNKVRLEKVSLDFSIFSMKSRVVKLNTDFISRKKVGEIIILI